MTRKVRQKLSGPPYFRTSTILSPSAKSDSISPMIGRMNLSSSSRRILPILIQRSPALTVSVGEVEEILVFADYDALLFCRCIPDSLVSCRSQFDIQHVDGVVSA